MANSKDVSIEVEGVGSRGETGKPAARAVRNPLASRAIVSTLESDLSARNITKSDFARDLELPVSSVGWWFSNNSIPIKQIMPVIQILGSRSMVFISVRELLRQKLKQSEKLPPRSHVLLLELQHNLEGFELLTKFIEKNIEGRSIGEALSLFKQEHSEYADILDQDWFKRHHVNEGGIGSLPLKGSIGVKVAKEALHLGSNTLAEYSRTVYGPPVEDLRLIRREIEKFAPHHFGDDVEELDTAHRPLEVNRTGIYGKNPDWLIGLVPVTYSKETDKKDKDGNPVKAVSTSNLKAVALDLYKAKLDDKLWNRKAMLVIYDKYSLIAYETVVLRKGLQLMMEHTKATTERQKQMRDRVHRDFMANSVETVMKDFDALGLNPVIVSSIDEVTITLKEKAEAIEGKSFDQDALPASDVEDLY
jgi:hypothetical protein